MTALKALEIFNAETENDISDELKKQWLSEIDVKIAKEINNGRSGLSKNVFLSDDDLATELSAVKEFSEIYISYLRMKMYYMLAKEAQQKQMLKQ